MSDRAVENLNFKPEEKEKQEGRPTLMGGTGAGGFRATASETLKPCYALIGLKDHKGPGSNVVRVKVSTADWVFLWRLWDQATRIDTPVEAINKYNRFSASLLQKYNVVLKPGEMAEFT